LLCKGEQSRTGTYLHALLQPLPSDQQLLDWPVLVYFINNYLNVVWPNVVWPAILCVAVQCQPVSSLHCMAAAEGHLDADAFQRADGGDAWLE
jgi:hypothetical protein